MDIFMRCSKCGVSIPARLSHCPNCGKKLHTFITYYSSNTYINQIDDNDEPLSALRRKGALLLTIPSFLFAVLCCLLLFLDITSVLHGIPAAHFRSSILFFSFGSPLEMITITIGLLFYMCCGFWGFAILLGAYTRRRKRTILTISVSLCLFAICILLLNTQTSFLLTALMYILCVTNVLGSINIYRSECGVLQTEAHSLTGNKAILLICYGIFIVLLLTAILLFRYSVIFP